MGVAPAAPGSRVRGRRASARRVDLGPPGTFVVTEVRTARFVTAAGRAALRRGARQRAALRRPLRAAAASSPPSTTARARTAEALYVGREVTPRRDGPARPARGRGAAEARRRRRRSRARSAAGPSRSARPTRRSAWPAPTAARCSTRRRTWRSWRRSRACPSSRSSRSARRADLHGMAWTVIGFMERSVTVEGIRYPWQEYLLYEPRQGFRWLVESKGHWSLRGAHQRGRREPARPAALSVPRPRPSALPGRPGHGRPRARASSTGRWPAGTRTETEDYVSPPLHALVREATSHEINWSLRHLHGAASEIWKAFGLPGEPPAPEGVAPHQPSPYAGRVGQRLDVAAPCRRARVLVLYSASCATGGRTVHKQTVADPPGRDAGLAGGGASSPTRSSWSTRQPRGRASSAPVSNSWLYLDGALINEETGAVDEFDLEVSYYFGSRQRRVLVGGRARGADATSPRCRPGRYVLRLEPQWEAGQRRRATTWRCAAACPRFYQAVPGPARSCSVWPIVRGAGGPMRFEAGAGGERSRRSECRATRATPTRATRAMGRTADEMATASSPCWSWDSTASPPGKGWELGVRQARAHPRERPPGPGRVPFATATGEEGSDGQWISHHMRPMLDSVLYSVHRAPSCSWSPSGSSRRSCPSP